MVCIYIWYTTYVGMHVCMCKSIAICTHIIYERIDFTDDRITENSEYRREIENKTFENLRETNPRAI